MQKVAGHLRESKQSENGNCEGVVGLLPRMLVAHGAAFEASAS